MTEQEVDDVRRSTSVIEFAATFFAFLLIGGVAGILLTPLVPEGFWVLIPVVVIYLYWEISGWWQTRAFRKEMKVLDRAGWDR